jgi:Amt family ammonium transporter
MFGLSSNGWFGTPGSLAGMAADDPWLFTFFVFQVVFVGTAATIVSGAVAERMAFAGYLVITLLIAVLIYPVFGHWAWGGLLNTDNKPWLAAQGFIDFAGSTVVHSVGGWIALAGIVVLGARIGRFGADGRPRAIHGHSMVLTAAGAMILFVGWIGFNGGSTTAGTPAFASIVANTVVAASFGGLAGMLAGRIVDGLWAPGRSINGLLAGLVGITAGCDAVGLQGAMWIGLACGLLVVASEEFLLRVCRLDDVVGAVSVHGVCGAAGTLLLAGFALEGKLPAGTRWDQFVVQLQGVVACFLWVFPLAWATFKLMDKTVGLRVSAEDELKGLNAAEHGATLGTGALQETLHRMVHVDRDLTQRLDESTGDETAEIAGIVNPFLGEVESLVARVGTQAGAVARTSDELGRLAHTMVRHAERMHSGTLSVDERSTALGQDTTQAAAATETMRTQARQVSEAALRMSSDIRQVCDSMSQLGESVREVAASAGQAGRLSDEARNVAASANGTMNALAEATSQIVGIVGFIERVAHQTNMLAINAAIEAANAGDAGKGFAVVAREVRTLADQTRKATDEIRQRVQAIQSQADGARHGMRGVHEIIETMNQTIRGIASAAERQDATAAESVQTVRGAAHRAHEVAEAMTAMNARIDDVAGFTTDVAGTAGAMRSSAQGLRTEADDVLGEARGLSGATGELDRVSRQLRDAAGAYRVTGAGTAP